MNVKIWLYIFIIPFTMWALMGLNINDLFKKNSILQARVIYVMLCFIISYLIVNFIMDFTSL